jgi:hypothetical protein
MPEDAKPPKPSDRRIIWGTFVALFLIIAMPFVLNTWLNWYVEQIRDRVDKATESTNAAAQAANPVGSTKRQVEDWLKANDFDEFIPVSLKRDVDDLVTRFNIPAKAATFFMGGWRPIAGGNPGENTTVYFFFGPDDKLITVYAIGYFPSL